MSKQLKIPVSLQALILRIGRSPEGFRVVRPRGKSRELGAFVIKKGEEIVEATNDVSRVEKLARKIGVLRDTEVLALEGSN